MGAKKGENNIPFEIALELSLLLELVNQDIYTFKFPISRFVTELLTKFCNNYDYDIYYDFRIKGICNDTIEEQINIFNSFKNYFIYNIELQKLGTWSYRQPILRWIKQVEKKIKYKNYINSIH